MARQDLTKLTPMTSTNRNSSNPAKIPLRFQLGPGKGLGPKEA